MKMRGPDGSRIGGKADIRSSKGLFLGRSRLGGLAPGEDRVVGVGAGQKNGEADGGEHETDRRVGGQFSEEVGCAAGAERGLRALAAERSGEVGGLALLQKDDADEEERDDDMEDDD